MQLGPAQLQFLARFARSPDGTALVEHLRARIAESDKAARNARGEDVHRHLGASDELDKLVADITEADSKLNRNMAAARPPTRRLLTD